MPWTNASIVLNSRDATGGTYNASKFNAENQNIIQGQIHSIAVAEVNFPYDIPNIQKGPIWSAAAAPPSGVNPYGIYNSFQIFTDVISPPAGVVLDIAITPGFYTGTELATAINNAITAENVAQGNPVTNAADLPLCVYDDSSNRFSFTLDAPVTAALQWFFASPFTYPVNQTAASTNVLGKDILSIMGFQTNQNGGNPFVSQADPLFAGGSAPMSFTQYIDICSPLMTQYQYFRDGSTSNKARRADVICRLYIANNVATQEEEGTRPFIINRQFQNERVMRWSAESAVGQIDINLFDDVGQPLLTSWVPRPFQITFNCFEQDKDDITY